MELISAKAEGRLQIGINFSLAKKHYYLGSNLTEFAPKKLLYIGLKIEAQNNKTHQNLL